MYDLIAHYYDLENATFTDDLGFWLELAEAHGGPVLELGCGTGRVLLHLARRGHAVTGVDNSPAMLARLQQKLEAASARHLTTAPHLILADMAAFRVEQVFRLAVMAFSTWLHLLTTEAQIAALTNIRRHLAPGAPLVIDVANPAEPYAAAEQGLTLERTFTAGDRTVQVFSMLRVDRTAQLGRVTWLYDSVGPGGDVQRLIVPLTLRYTFPGELRLLLEKCGFALTHLWGDYDRSPLTDTAPRLIAFALAQ
jgi:SAM-dependent methyltransferase